MMVVVEKEKEMEEVVAWRLEVLKQVIGIVGFFYWNENLNVSLKKTNNQHDAAWGGSI